MPGIHVKFSVWEFVDRIFTIHDDGYYWRKEQRREQKALKKKNKSHRPKFTWTVLTPRAAPPPTSLHPEREFPYETRTEPVSRAPSPHPPPRPTPHHTPNPHTPPAKGATASPPARGAAGDQDQAMITPSVKQSVEQSALEDLRSLHSQQRMAPGVPIQRVERHRPRVRYAGLAACRSPRKAVVAGAEIEHGEEGREEDMGGDEMGGEEEEEEEGIGGAVDYHAALEEITREDDTGDYGERRGRRMVRNSHGISREGGAGDDGERRGRRMVRTSHGISRRST